MCLGMGNGFLDEDGHRPRKRSAGSPRVGAPSGTPSAHIPTIKLGRMAYGGCITTHLRRTMAREKRATGRRSYAKTTQPSSGRYNARGRGRGILKTIPARPGLYGQPWIREGGMGYRARRVIVKARVMKLRGGTARTAYSHLKYLQRDGAGLEKETSEDGEIKLLETRGELYGPDRYGEYGECCAS